MPDPIIIDNPNPRDHLRTEWLLTNGLGGYAMGTVLGINTRRYHGLLVAAANPPVGRIVALHSMIEQLIIPREDGTEEVIDLSTQIFVGPDGEPMLHPQGWKWLHRVAVNDCQVEWEWRVKDVIVTRRVLIVRQRNEVIIHFKVTGAHSGLLIRPLVALRGVHALGVRTNDWPSLQQHKGWLELERDGCAIAIWSDGADFEFDPQWWKSFHYNEDTLRGQASSEDCWSPGAYVLSDSGASECTLKCRLWSEPGTAGRSIEARIHSLKRGLRIGLKRTLSNAADQFVVHRRGKSGSTTSVIAGYPWFADWGRDAMISLPGLLLCTQRFDEAKSLLLLFASHLRNGLIPNRFDDATSEPHYNTVDASLWFIHAVRQYWKATKPLSGGAGVTPVTPDEGSMPSSGVRTGTTDHLRITRRRLPHWEMGGSTYFITFGLRSGAFSPEERRIVAEAVQHWHNQRMHLHIAVVMPDHVHMLLQPLEKSRGLWWPLAEIMHSIKSFTAHRIQKLRGDRGALWQDESFDRIVRDESEFLEKWNYIETNPVRKGLVADFREYPFIVRPTTAEAAIEADPAVTGGTPAPPLPGGAGVPPATLEDGSMPFSGVRTAGNLDPLLLAACRAIIHAYREGTDFDIRMDPADCLISAGNENTQLTWMDAARDGIIFTPRHGKPVEVNALWFNALQCLAEMTDDVDESKKLRDLAARVRESFVRAFWWDEKQCLHDVLVPPPSQGGGQGVGRSFEQADRSTPLPTSPLRGGRSFLPDSKLRPNQILAVSLPFSPLAREQQRAVVNVVREKFLTPFGLRTLDRDDLDYKGRFEGNLFERDRAYHNGACWPWLLGPYCEAVLRVNDFSDAAKCETRETLQPLLDELSRTSGPGCLGQLAEVYDGDAPQRPGGCTAQAWSVGEALRILTLIDDPKWTKDD